MPDTQRPMNDAQYPSDKPRLLIIEDDELLGILMRGALVHDYEVSLAEDQPTALEIQRRERPAVVTLDLGLPPHPQEVKEGFEVLGNILQQDPEAKVIVITGHEEQQHALRAIGHGVYDFFCKPIQIDELKVVLRRAFHLHRLEQEHRQLQRCLDGQSFEGMVGTSPQMQEVFAAIRKVATTDVPVLIVGESGTGKEMVARAIHRQSTRKESSFIAINCSAIPETLLESELFGHDKGAFTGAHIQRRGRIEVAQGGTLFLDEIGTLPLPVQIKLLRFLQEHRIQRIGGREEITVDLQVVTATNTDLRQAINEGRFREDLYHRLAVVIISLPPLRDREGDILLLARTLLQRYADSRKKKITGFTEPALRALESHKWSGNVRELENRIRRAVIMGEGARITPGDLELASKHQNYMGVRLRKAREALDEDLIRSALVKNKGNLTRAAAELRISRPALYDLRVKLGIGRK